MPIVLIPYRETPDGARSRQLRQLTTVLQAARLNYWVVTQNKGGRFNRGLVCNAGLFALAQTGYRGMVIVHDADLLPDPATLALYHQLDGVPDTAFYCLHSSSRYGSDRHFGGVVAARMRVFTVLGGFPNAFWGWGGEDDELGRRVVSARLEVRRPRCQHHDLEQMDLSTKLAQLRVEDAKARWKWETRKLYQAGCLRDGYQEIPALAAVVPTRAGRLMVEPRIFFFCDDNLGLVHLWIAMSAAERRDQVRDRLRRRLGKPPETEQDRLVAEALENPAKFLKNVDPATVQKALSMMQDLPAEALGEDSDHILAAMNKCVSSKASDPEPGEGKKKRRRKRKKTKPRQADNPVASGPKAPAASDVTETEAPPPLPLEDLFLPAQNVGGDDPEQRAEEQSYENNRDLAAGLQVESE